MVLHGSLVALRSPFFTPLFTTRPSDSRLGIFLLSLKWQSGSPVFGALDLKFNPEMWRPSCCCDWSNGNESLWNFWCEVFNWDMGKLLKYHLPKVPFSGCLWEWPWKRINQRKKPDMLFFLNQQQQRQVFGKQIAVGICWVCPNGSLR